MLGLLLLLSIPREVPKVELGPPSYGFPVYFVRSVEQPAKVRGYVWGRHDYGSQSKWGYPDPGWALWRTTKSPPDDSALFGPIEIGSERWMAGWR